ncbi:hypothetical protein LguiA_026651 [Lonicera macranthoides]
MEVEKRSSKGGFFQLFDWNVKSRKKLFSNKSELPERLGHGKENVDGSAISRLQQMTALENGFCSSIRGSDHSCSSSVSNDDVSGTKAPGVVAKLMGLDSLPNSNIPEPVFNSHSFRDYHPSRNTTDFQSERQNIGYSSTRGKLDGFTRNPVEHRLQKVQNRPIERFQSEMLPPKSAKAISITHHRLLSPIKSPGFILTKNAAYVMEAAAKIIEQSPQSTIKGKFPHVGSPSVPLRIRDLKERMDAARQTSRVTEVPQRPKEHGSIKYVKGSQIDSEDSKLIKGSMVSKQSGAGSLKKKDKSVSLAIQAKANVPRKEEPASSGSKSYRNHREDKEVKQQRITQKSVQKRTSKARNSDVLKQNNQKQNIAPTKERSSTNSITSDLKVKKPLSKNGPFRESKTSNQVVENAVTRTRKNNELSSSESKNFSGKKRSVNGDVHSNITVDDVLKRKNEKSLVCNFSSDGCANWDAVDVKSGMDVVSFTFTSPIKKSSSGSQSSDRYDDQLYLKTSSSLELNVIGSDALSVLLEQKLKELSCKVESHSKVVEPEYASTSASTSLDLASSVDKKVQRGVHEDQPVSQNDSDCSSISGLQLSREQELQGSEEMEEHSSGARNSEYEKGLECQYFSPISIVEPAFTDGSCNSDAKTSITLIGNQLHLSEIVPNWELEYIRDVLSTAESISKNSLLDPAHKFIESNLFDHLENQTTGSDKNMDEYSKLERKVLFDCLSERLEFRRERLFGGGFKSWVKWTRFSQKKEWLGEELYKEISGWTSMEELMVDELVEKDMSSQYGKWVDFEVEEYEDGVEIEEGILTCLVDQLVVDLLLL